MKSIDKINMILMQKGMSGAEMSTKAGFSNSVYSQWNTGKTKPGKKSLVKAAAALEVNVEDIMDDDDLSLPYGYQALNKAQYDLAKLHHEKAQKEENPPPVGDGLVDKISALAQSPGLLEELNRFLELAAEDPETARRFLAFAVQELQSSRPLR